MDRSKSLAKNTFILSFGTILPKLASFITLPILTAGLTKTEYGTYDLINTLDSLFLPIVTLQVQSAAFRFLIDCRSNEEKTNRIITNIVGFIIPTSIIALVILFLSLGNLPYGLRIMVCTYFFADTFNSAVQQIVRGLSKNKLYSLSAIIQSFVNMILIIITVQWFKQGIEGTIFSIAIATIISALILASGSKLHKKIQPSLLSKQTIREILSYSWPMIPNSLSNWVLSMSDRLVLTCFIGLQANAIYAVANKIPSLLMMVQGTFIFAWQENASLVSKDEDSEEYYSAMFDFMFNIMSGMLALLIAATPILFELLIKGNYSEAYYQMPLLMFAMLFSTLASYMGGIYVAHMKTKSVGVTTTITALVNLIISLSLVKLIGIYAVSLATLISYFLLMVYRMIDAKKFQPIHYKVKKIIIYLVILLIMCCLCWRRSLLHFLLNGLIAILVAFYANHQLIINFITKIRSFRK